MADATSEIEAMPTHAASLENATFIRAEVSGKQWFSFVCRIRRSIPA